MNCWSHTGDRETGRLSNNHYLGSSSITKVLPWNSRALVLLCFFLWWEWIFNLLSRIRKVMVALQLFQDIKINLFIDYSYKIININMHINMDNNCPIIVCLCRHRGYRSFVCLACWCMLIMHFPLIFFLIQAITGWIT